MTHTDPIHHPLRSTASGSAVRVLARLARSSAAQNRYPHLTQPAVAVPAARKSQCWRGFPPTTALIEADHGQTTTPATH